MGAGGNFPPAPFFPMITLQELLRRWRRPLTSAALFALALGAGFASLAASKAEDPSAVLAILLAAAAASMLFPPIAVVFMALSEAHDYIRARGRRV